MNKSKKNNSEVEPAYFTWLNQFAENHDSFYTDDAINDISSGDQKQLIKLKNLFRMISTWASANYIYAFSTDFGEYYCLKVGNNGYAIGYMAGQGVCYYCKKIPLSALNDFIDYQDILNNNKGSNVDKITNDLYHLSNEVITLADKGIPISAIEDTLTKSLDYLHEREKNQSRKLIRK
jgi:hypothetical protein